MSGSVRVGLAGATGAVGREILAMLETVDAVAEVVPMASPASKVHQVEFRGGNLRVENLHAEALGTCDVAILAVPPTVAARAVALAQDRGLAVLDCTGHLAAADPAVPRVVAAVNRGDLEQFPETRAVACPGSLTVALATLLAPIRAQVHGLRCRGLALHSASSRGRAGIEELSDQVVSLFNSRTPRQVVFPHGLAFDVEPMVGEPGGDGWTDVEERVAQETAGLLSLGREDLAVASVVAPWFNGLALSLHLVTEPRLDLDALARFLGEADGISLVGGHAREDIPRPRSTDGSRDLLVGRLRADPAGEGLHLWAVGDEIRQGVAGNAVAVLEALAEDGWL